MGKPKKSTEEYLQRIRDFYKQHGRTPKSHDIDEYTNAILVKRLGSWKAAIQTALGDGVFHLAPSKEQVIKMLQELHLKLGRLPLPDEFEHKDRTEVFWSGMNEALLVAVGTNYTREIFKTILELTPPGCESATTQEIFVALMKRLPLKMNMIRALLNRSKRQGYIHGNRLSRTFVWKLTQAGNKFLQDKS